MDTKKHTRNRAAVRNTRPARRHRRTRLARPASANVVGPLGAHITGQRPAVGDHIRTLLHNLRLVRCVVSVSAEILSYQRCDYDEEVAVMLRRNAVDQLEAEIERMESMLGEIEGKPPEPGPSPVGAGSPQAA